MFILSKNITNKQLETSTLTSYYGLLPSCRHISNWIMRYSPSNLHRLVNTDDNLPKIFRKFS